MKVVAALSLAVPLAGASPADGQTRLITGKVTDPGGLPVAEAQIKGRGFAVRARPGYMADK